MKNKIINLVAHAVIASVKASGYAGKTLPSVRVPHPGKKISVKNNKCEYELVCCEKQIVRGVRTRWVGIKATTAAGEERISFYAREYSAGWGRWRSRQHGVGVELRRLGITPAIVRALVGAWIAAESA